MKGVFLPRSAAMNRFRTCTARSARVGFAVLLFFPLLAMPGTGRAEDDIAMLRKQVEQRRALTPAAMRGMAHF